MLESLSSDDINEGPDSGSVQEADIDTTDVELTSIGEPLHSCNVHLLTLLDFQKFKKRLHTMKC